jgi:hypothetical protein
VRTEARRPLRWPLADAIEREIRLCVERLEKRELSLQPSRQFLAAIRAGERSVDLARPRDEAYAENPLSQRLDAIGESADVNRGQRARTHSGWSPLPRVSIPERDRVAAHPRDRRQSGDVDANDAAAEPQGALLLRVTPDDRPELEQ